jgi:hypothetical protein
MPFILSSNRHSCRHSWLQDDYIDDTMDAENYESSFDEWGGS